MAIKQRISIAPLLLIAATLGATTLATLHAKPIDLGGSGARASSG